MSVTPVSSGVAPSYGPGSVSHVRQPSAPVQQPAPAQQSDADAERKSSRSNSGTGGRSSTGAALYSLISQMGSSDPSTSELLKSWNSIMQTGQAALPSQGPAAESNGLHLTA